VHQVPYNTFVTLAKTNPTGQNKLAHTAPPKARGGKRTPPARKLTDALVRVFIDTALPGGHRCLGQPFHYQECRRPGFWKPSAVGLRLGHVRMHLEGKIIIAPVWPSLVDCFEIDLDAHDDDDRETLLARLDAVIRLFEVDVGREVNRFDRFHGAPGNIWRSSSGIYGGLRYRMMLDRLHDRDELAARVASVVKAAKIPGPLEVMPRGHMHTRAPCGAGSMLVDENKEPLTEGDPESAGLGNQLRAWRRIRDSAAMVRGWALLAEARRFPIDFILGTTTANAASASCPAPYVKNTGGSRGAARPMGPTGPARTAWGSHIADLELNGAPAGGRFDAIRDLTFHWAVTCGLSDIEVHDRMRVWLASAPHSSKDVTGPDGQRNQALALAGVPARLRRLGADLANGKLSAGTPAKSSRLGRRAHAGQGVPLLSSCNERYTRGPKWRAHLLSSLAAADLALVAQEPDGRTRNALGVLLALLRATQQGSPTATRVAVPRQVLQTIMGGGARIFLDSKGLRLTPYRFLMERALHLGVLGARLSVGTKCTHEASIFALPARP
jgi:hypothetical protein